MVGFHVRPATEADIQAVQEVARWTWFATYAGHVADDDIDRFVRANYNYARLRRAIERLGEGFLVADTDDGIAGYAMVSATDEATAELHSIYILPRYHGQGIGKALWAEAVDYASASGFAALALWVLASNERARRFYERHGAIATEEREFRLGDGLIVETRYVLWLAPT